jgi:hypothetical protein
MPDRSPTTLAVIRSEAELRSLEAASFNPPMLRRIATGARATLLTATDFTIADGLLAGLETPLLRRTPRKTDRPISIVFETEQIDVRLPDVLNYRLTGAITAMRSGPVRTFSAFAAVAAALNARYGSVSPQDCIRPALMYSTIWLTTVPQPSWNPISSCFLRVSSLP